jgi:aldehyde dehydrogenase (NAD+)
MEDVLNRFSLVHPYLDGKTKKMLIDNRWVPSVTERTFQTVNPATGATIADVALGSEADIDLAVAAARRAFEGPWSRISPAERQAMLLKLADLVEANFEHLAWLATLDMGAPITRQLGFKKRAVGLLRYYAAMALQISGETVENSLSKDIISYTIREPLGVVGAITPWNGPIPATIWKLGPVLATGCTLVLKPAEQAPLVPLRIGELLLEAGIPAGVINIVPGFGGDAGARLAAHPDVDKVAFTGSHTTGQKIVRASAGNMKRLTMELGGKSPNIVFADADLDAAVQGAALAIFSNTGQICSAGSRLFVQKPIYEEFVEKVAAYGRRMKMGPGIDPQTQIGPVVSREQLDRVENYLKIAKDEGASTIEGGDRSIEPELKPGYFVAPTVLSNLKDSMRISQEEIFGPVLSTYAFEDIEEVVQRANSTQFGLGCGIWSRDLATVHKMTRRIKSGAVWANAYQLADPAMPFGGYKMSGYGRESGRQHVEEYTNVKSVWINVQ